MHQRRLIGLLATACAVFVSFGASAQAQTPALQLNVLSTRADLISGGDALTSITLPAGTKASSVTVTLNGSEITNQFAERPNGLFEGLVTGLVLGKNTLEASAPGVEHASMTLIDHPQSGPVFSGPEVQPWTCNSGATDAGCDMPPTYSYEYEPVGGGGLQSYNPSSPPPSELIATTTTDQGNTVPFIVRIETGSIDRGQYEIAVLDNPSEPWEPWDPQKGWDGKLEIPGGSSCGTGHVESTSPSVTDTNALGLGFAVASDALLNNGANCNIVTQAETAEMLKEYFIDHYGPIQYTIATGCSGGSIFQQQTNNAYPGLYQGEIVECSFPDSWSTTMETIDCQLLLSYFSSNPGLTDLWTETEMADVLGDQSVSGCETWVNVYGYNKLGDPSGDGSTVGPACGVSTADTYNASTNPGGVRCDLEDYMVNEFGERPASEWTAPEKTIGHGFANDPYDDAGIQFGLNALMDGEITPQQFADLNAGVGGLTVDDQPQAARSTADPLALKRLYQTGAINEFNKLAGVPIIDLRGQDSYEIHEDFRSYASRARLDHSTGGHDNQIIWLAPVPLEGDAQYETDAFDLMNTWLAKIEADHSGSSLPAKVEKDKPAAAVDECWNGAGQPITNQQACNTLFPVYGDPRIAAGEPFSDDVMACQLKPLVRSDYFPVQFTDAEWAELETAFPNGVCNNDKPGVGQQGAIPWMTYQNSDGSVLYGGRSLGRAPARSGLGWTSSSFDWWLGQ